MSGRDAVAGVLLAAGEGSRLGMPKALLRVGGRPLVERGASLLREAGCDPVLAVVGAEAEEVRPLVPPGIVIVENERWRQGMGSSLGCGLAALEEDVGAALLALVDQPGITVPACERLITTWRQGARAVVATYEGAQRNPVILDRSLWAEATAAATGDRGARALLRTKPWLVTTVACEDVADPSDIDTREDLDGQFGTLRG